MGLPVGIHWQIGDPTRKDILNEKQAEYGKEIISILSIQLVKEFGRGFSRRNLFNMIRFAEVFPDKEIVVSLIRQLSWTHFIGLVCQRDVINLTPSFLLYLGKCRKYHVKLLD